MRMCAEWNLGAGAVRLLMGGGPDEVPERYAVADPAALPPPPVPVTLVHGTDDDTVPIAMSQLPRTGRLVAIPGAGHFDLIDPLSAAWPQVLAALTGIHLPSLKELCPLRSGAAGDTAWRTWPGPGLDPSFPWPPGT